MFARIRSARPWQSRLGVWVMWVLATTVGWLVGSGVVLLVLAGTTGVADAFVRSGAGSALLGAIVGFAIAGFQWLVLRREVYGVRGWIHVSVGAWAVAWTLGQALTNALLD